MDYFPNGSLSSYCNSGYTLNESELRDAASCCLLGLHYLNIRRIIHGVYDEYGIKNRISGQEACSYAMMG